MQADRAKLEALLETLTERERQVVVMANDGWRGPSGDWPHAKADECRPLEALGLMQYGPNISLPFNEETGTFPRDDVNYPSFYGTELGRQASAIIRAKLGAADAS